MPKKTELQVPSFDACLKAFHNTMRDVLSVDGITLEAWQASTPAHEQFYMMRDFLRHPDVFMDVARKNAGIAKRKATRRRKKNEQEK